MSNLYVEKFILDILSHPWVKWMDIWLVCCLNPNINHKLDHQPLYSDAEVQNFIYFDALLKISIELFPVLPQKNLVSRNELQFLSGTLGILIDIMLNRPILVSPVSRYQFRNLRLDKDYTYQPCELEAVKVLSQPLQKYIISLDFNKWQLLTSEELHQEFTSMIETLKDFLNLYFDHYTALPKKYRISKIKKDP